MWSRLALSLCLFALAVSPAAMAKGSPSPAAPPASAAGPSGALAPLSGDDDSGATDSSSDDTDLVPTPGSAVHQGTSPAAAPPANDSGADAGTPAPAGSLPAVLVLPYAPLYGEMPQSAGDKATGLVEDELSATNQFSVVHLTVPSAQAAAWKQDLDQARDQIAQAIANFDQADGLVKRHRITVAAKLYEKGIQRFLGNFQGADDFQPLSDAYLQLSMAQFRLGSEKESMKLLGDMIRIDPARVLKKGEVVNLFVMLQNRQRKEYLAKPRGSLKVLSSPEGATVTLDGHRLGETPLLAQGIVPGDHYLLVVKPDAGAYWKTVSVASGDEVDVTADLFGKAGGARSNVAKALADNAFSAPILGDIQQLGRQAQADYVLFGALHKTGQLIHAHTYALRVKDQKVELLAPLEFDPQMIGAEIEVFKLTSDLSRKVAAFQGVVPDGSVAFFPKARPVSVEASLNVVTVTGTGAGPAVASSESAAGEDHLRPVTHEDQTPPPAVPHRPVVVVAGGGPPDSAAAMPPHPTRRLRPVAPIAEQPAAPVTGPVPAPVVTPIGTAAVKPAPVTAPAPKVAPATQQNVLEQVEAEETQTPSAPPPKPVDLQPALPAPKASSMSDLSPEQMHQMEEMESGQSHSSTATILMWSGIGVVAAGGLAYLGYALLSPKTPTSATATITW